MNPQGMHLPPSQLPAVHHVVPVAQPQPLHAQKGGQALGAPVKDVVLQRRTLLPHQPAAGGGKPQVFTATPAWLQA